MECCSNLLETSKSSSIQNKDWGNKTVYVEHGNKEDKYFVSTDQDGRQQIFTDDSQQINFMLNDISDESLILIEIKYDCTDYSDISSCMNGCASFFLVNEADCSFMIKNKEYSKCSVVKVIDDREIMKIPISFKCLTSHHRQGLFYKIKFFIGLSSQNEQEKKELGSFLIKVSKNPERDFRRKSTNPETLKKRKRSGSEHDGSYSTVEKENNNVSYLVVPRNNAAKQKIIDFVNSHNGSVQEYYLSDRNL